MLEEGDIMRDLTVQEIQTLRELGVQVAEIAGLPKQKETIRLWEKLNGLKPERPMVTIDQLPWHELNIDGSLNLQVEEPFFRTIEQNLRRILFQWRHFPADMVVMPWIAVPMAIENSGWCDLNIKTDMTYTDPTSDVISHRYIPAFTREEDLEAFHNPVITINQAENTWRRETAQKVFDGIIPVKMTGLSTMYHPWDHTCGIIGIQETLEMLIAEPELAHKLCQKMHQIMLSEMEQLEMLGALESPQPLIHCTGAFSDELPKPGYDPEKPCACDVWTAGMSQIFGSVSPAMHKEFDLDYAADYYKHFGLVYYGCCEPLHDRISLIRAIPNVRKISTSPWANVEIAGEQMAGDFVMSRKPNPAYLAPQSADLDSAMKEIDKTLEVCRNNHTPCELILKDVSTISYHIERLVQWERQVMERVKA